jgi:hypothetical protein
VSIGAEQSGARAETQELGPHARQRKYYLKFTAVRNACIVSLF